MFEGGPGDEAGKFLLDPRGIASDRAGCIYVADTGNARIQKFSPDGLFVAAIGESGTGRGQLKAPNGIAIDSNGDIFVTDTVNQKLVEYLSNGSLVNEWTDEASPFYGPRDIAFGPNKVLYIVDQGRTRIVMFDTSTASFSAWGSGGSGDGQFNEATGITVGANMVFVADRGNNRVQVFDLAGKFIRQWKVPEWGESTDQFPDLAYDDASKQVYVTSGKTNQLLSFDTNGRPVDGKLKAVGDASLKNPSSVIISNVGTSKRLYVLNTAKANVAAFDWSK
jgi:DNA-binding beta-propeller fold protein YncE